MNHKLKRLLALVLALSMTLSLMSTAAWAVEPEDEPTEAEVVTEAEESTEAGGVTEAAEPTEAEEPADAGGVTEAAEPTEAEEPTDAGGVTEAAEPTEAEEPTEVGEVNEAEEPTEAEAITEKEEPTQAPERKSPPQTEDPDEGEELPEAEAEESVTEEALMANSPHSHNNLTFAEWTSTNSLPNEAGNYVLTANVTLSETWNVPTGTTNLCLNGYGILRANGRVIAVGGGAILNLYDCNSTNQTHKFTVGDAGYAVVNDSAAGSGVKTFSGGYITSKVNFDSSASYSNSKGMYITGGGVVVMNGGTIIGNSSSDFGGGIFLDGNTSAFTMNNGAIMYNVSNTDGGGLEGNNANVTINGGSISYNRANGYGGGIDTARLSITGGTITGNQSKTNGGGVDLWGGTLYLSGSPVITGNTNNGATNNVCLWSGLKISVSGTLTNDSQNPIGVNITNGTGVLTSSNNTALNDMSKFTSDNASYLVGKNQSGQLLLGEPRTVTYNANNATSGSAPTDSSSPYASGSYITTLGNTGNLARTGYTFDGWNTQANGGGTSVAAGGQFTITENTTLYAKWTPVPATPATITNASGATLTYGYTSGSVSVTATAANGHTITGYQWYINTTNSNTGGTAVGNATSAVYNIPAGKNANTTEYYYCVVTTKRSDNAQTATATSSALAVTVNKADSAVTHAPTANDLTYNGSPQLLVDQGTASGGTMKYAVSDSGTTAPTSGWSTDIPKRTNAGTCYVWYRVDGDANHNDVIAQSVSVEIKTTSLTITAKPKTITYGDAPANNGVTYSGFVNNQTEAVLSGTLSYSYSYSQYGSVGSYTITPSGLTSTNYTITFQTGALTVQKKAVGLNWSNTSLTYNGQPQKPTATATGLVNNDSISVTVDGAQTHAGTYSATAMELTGDKVGNYKLPDSTTQSFTIQRKPVEAFITITNLDAEGKLPYGVFPKFTVTEGNGNGAVIPAEEYTWSITPAMPGGTGKLTVTSNTSGNYAFTQANETAETAYESSMGQAAINQLPRANVLTYTGAAQTLLTAGTGIDGTMEYALVEHEAEVPAPTANAWTAELPKGTDAGIYDVWYRVVGNSGYVNWTANAPVNVCIAPQPLTVTAKNQTVNYGTAITQGTNQVEAADFVNSDTLSAITLTQSTTDATTTGSITPSGAVIKHGSTDVSANYTVTYVDGALTIDRKTVALVWNHTGDLVYNGQPQAPTATVDPTSLEQGDACTVTVTGEQTNAGDYTAAAASLSSPNYKLPTDGTQQAAFSIAKAPLTITADDKSSPYKSQPVELTWQVSGTTYDDLALKAECPVTTSSAVGPYPDSITVSWDGAANDNYDVTFVPGTYTVTKAGAYVTATGYSEEYDGQPHSITVTVKTGNNADADDLQTTAYGQGNEAAVYYSTVSAEDAQNRKITTNPVYTNAGTYTVYYYVDLTNYLVDAIGSVDGVSGSKSVIIKPKTILVTADRQHKLYDEADPALTYQNDPLVDGDSFTGKLERDPGETVGTYAISQGSLTAGSNYTIRFVGAKLTISKAPHGEVTKPTDKANIYNGQPQPLLKPGSVKHGAVVYSMTVSGPYTEEIPTGIDAGSYTIYYKVDGQGCYTDAEPDCVTATIQPKTVGLKWSNLKFTYDGKSHIPTATATGLANGDTCAVTVIGAQINAGTYTAKATKLSNANYKLPAEVAQNYSIAKAKQSAPTAPVIIAVTGNSITVRVIKGQQYSIDGGKTWKTPTGTSYTFKNLTAGKQYTVITRKTETANYFASTKSSGTKTKSLPNAMLLGTGFKVQSKGKKITITCGRVPGADSYEVYIQYCGKAFNKTPDVVLKNGKTSITVNRINGKAVQTNKAFKIYVIAKRGKSVIARMPLIHFAGSTSGTYTNVKSVKLDKTSISLKKGKSATIKATLTLEQQKKKLLGKFHGAALRYTSSDTRVAVVDANGKITAKGAGTCVIQVMTLNGLSKNVTVTVK